MTREQVIGIITALGWNSYTIPSYRDWVQVSCPFAPWLHKHGTDSHPSYSLNVAKSGVGRCFTCGEGGSLWEVLSFLGMLKKDESLLKIADSVLEDAPTPLEVSFLRAEDKFRLEQAEEVNRMALEAWFTTLPTTSPEMLQYFCKRNYDTDDFIVVAGDFDLRWDDEEKRVVVPIFDINHKFVGAQGRTTIDDEAKTKNYWGTKKTDSLVYPYMTKLDMVQAVILVEGPFDAYRIYRYLDLLGLGYLFTPMCCMSWHISEEQKAFLEKLYVPVYSMLDNDKEGLRGWNYLTEVLGGGKVPMLKRINYTPEVKDPDTLPIVDFLSALRATLAAGVRGPTYFDVMLKKVMSS